MYRRDGVKMFNKQVQTANRQPTDSQITEVHCSVIIGRNLVEANVNTSAIQLPGNPSAPTWKSFSHYRKSFRIFR